jgi:hypothetical protein
MFITLTSCDAGQTLDVRADCVSTIEYVDQRNTLIVVAGAEHLVRESPERVKEAIYAALGADVPLPGLRAARVHKPAW